MTLLSEEVISSLGLTLLDSLWQGAVVLLLCTLTLWILRRSAARWRYRVVLTAMLILPLASIITFSGYYQSPKLAETPGILSFQTNQTALLPEGSGQLAADPGILEQWNSWAQANASWVALLWVIGLVLFGFRLMGGFYMLRTLKAHAVVPEDPAWTEKLNALCKSLELRFKVRLKESVRVSSPIVLGYLKPLIIFPIGLLEGLPTDQVEAILLHELAHIKRHDYLLNMLVSLLQVVFFYHPAYWWLQRQLDNEREYSCDDIVLSQTGGMSLIRALTAVKEFQLNSYTPSLGFAGQRNQLLKRVERIMNKKTRTNWLGGLISTSALLLSFFLMSYQSKHNTEIEQPSTVEPANVVVTPPALVIEQEKDSLTVKEALIRLMDKEEHDLELELDSQGRLTGIKKNGKAVSRADLKTYKAAHTRLRQYIDQEARLQQTTEKLEEELVQLKRQVEQMSKETELEEYRYRVVEELKKQEQQQEIATYRLAEQLKNNQEANETYQLTLRVLKEMEQRSQQELQQAEEKSRQLGKQLRVYEELARKLNETTPIGTYAFESSRTGQMEAVSYLASLSRSSTSALVVLNGEAKPDWTMSDIDEMDRNLYISSIRVSKAGDDAADQYKRYTKGLDHVVEVSTKKGSEAFERPRVPTISVWRKMNNEQAMQERFSKTMIETMSEDQLATDGWSSIELSTEGFLIDGKKQSKKILKKYLKLYEEVTGKALPKGETISLKD